MRPKTFKREEVVEKAMAVFWRKGYSATSSDDILKAMGIGEGSFYREFPGGKRELFETVLKQYHEPRFNLFKETIETSPNPLETIKLLFKTKSTMKESDHMQGCLICNTIVEMASLDQSLEKEAADKLKEVEAVFCAAIERAKEHNQISNKNSSAIIALQLITLWTGLDITRRMYPKNELLNDLINKGLEILE
jgi:TetR/AcrR family transcriptional repressor of nem operon